ASPLGLHPRRLNGASARRLASHYENNYGGAVRRLNAIRSDLVRLAVAGAPGFVLNGLKREELIATNSMLLHELYFDGLGGSGGGPAGGGPGAVARAVGAVQHWGGHGRPLVR